MSISYVLVDSAVAPEVFVKVVEAKNYLASGRCKTIGEALEHAKISRTAFYKYKNYVFSYNDAKREKMLTLEFTLEDISGVLSDILTMLAKYRTNVLTINQNIPVNGIANVTISVETGSMLMDNDELIKNLRTVHGVNKVRIIAMK
jgi:chorismate mutase